MYQYLRLIVLVGLVSFTAEAAEPVLCSGSVVDEETGATVGPLNDGVFYVDQLGEIPGRHSRLVVAELGEFTVSVRRSHSSALLITPEIVIEVLHRASLPLYAGERLAFAAGQNHVSLGFESKKKSFQFKCYESAYMKSHNDLLCGSAESARATSPYRKTCESLCRNPKQNFTSEETCAPYQP